MIKEKLIKFFENTYASEHMDYVVQMLSLTDKEIESLNEEKLQTISEQSTENYKINFEEYAETSTAGEHKPRRHKNPMRSGEYKGHYGGNKQSFNQYNIPEEYQPTKKMGLSSICLNLDCATNREQLIEEWDNEMRLIIKTDDNLINDFDLIYTLAKSKTSGNVRLMLEQLDVSFFADTTGENFLTHITNSIYTVFTGKNYLTQGIEEKLKKAENARIRLENLQLCDLCSLESFYCDYEKHLMQIPMVEWEKYVKTFVMKIPFAGEHVLSEYENSGEILKKSLAHAKLLITNFMEKHCRDIQIKKAMKKTFNKCCSEFPNPETMYGCKPKDSIKWKTRYKKIKRKYKLKNPKKWKNQYKNRRPYKRFFRKNRYQNRDLREKPQGHNDPKIEEKQKFCPQGKATCRCWICNETGHYARECTKRTSGYNKILEELQRFELEPIFSDDEISEKEEVWELTSDDESDSTDSE